MSRRASRVDVNQVDVVDALRAVGCFVQSLAAIGKGCPDLLVAIPARGGRQPTPARWIVIEVKDGSLPSSARRLTGPQKAWHREAVAPVHIANNVDEALMIVGAR